MLDNEFKKFATEKLKSMDSNELKKAFKEIGSEPETNEEWFCSLSAEEKAKVLYRKSHKNFIRALNGKMPITSKEWEMWLKQPHTKR